MEMNRVTADVWSFHYWQPKPKKNKMNWKSPCNDADHLGIKETPYHKNTFNKAVKALDCLRDKFKSLYKSWQVSILTRLRDSEKSRLTPVFIVGLRMNESTSPPTPTEVYDADEKPVMAEPGRVGPSNGQDGSIVWLYCAYFIFTWLFGQFGRKVDY